ncbi:InlB B-repeat-containing protein [Bifidobacterium longum]|uniref:InlB B-repeat-containing protein n=1 Tax=Bifidobacterium longum TaxID=216816 RepID=UPI00356A5421
MRTWLKRMVAGIVSAGTLMGGGLLTAGTANADEIRMPDIGKTITSLTASAATTYPRELVNGDFEYPSMKSLQHYFTGIDRNRSQWISNGQGGDLAKWSDIPGGLDTTRFGWSSTQTQGAMSEQRANAVELQKATGETTQMGELCASQKGTAIYQDIATTPGTLYRIELDHASRYSIHLDQMQVMVGAPGHEQPVEMTRTSSNKYGDKIGEKSTTIATHSTNPFGNQSSKDDFSHYVGYYTIPAGQSVTRFTFRQVSGVNTTSGNLLDNIVFTQAYKLDYDRNSDEATGQTPNDTATVKPAKTSATGGVKNVADTNASLPGHLVNGDFEYLPDGGWKTVDAPSYMTNAYTSVDPNNGQYMRNAQHSDADLASWVDWPGFDQSKFAWKTDQKGGHDQGGLKDRAEAVELQQDSMDGNTYAEMVASETGRTIYQNLATIPGTLYKIRLKHASLCKDNVDQMQVVINGTPIEMTRVAANGKAGDKVGEKSKTIGTRVTNENRWHHSDQWETYEGYYVIPDGQTTTRFGFKAVNYLDPTKGNLLDDVTFARAYKLSYDKNASDATGSVPSNQRGKENTVQPAKAKTTGTVKLAADGTASGLPVHDLKKGDIAPAQYGDFKFSTLGNLDANQITDVEGFTVKDNWFPIDNVENPNYVSYLPSRDGATLTLKHVGEWVDSSGVKQWINARLIVNNPDAGCLYYERQTRSVGMGIGKWHASASSRPYLDMSVEFLLDDGTTPQGLRGVTGFTDLDGGTSGYNEGVELVSGFDGAYVRSDAHLTRFGTNGWAGNTDENANASDSHGMKHYLGATFTGSSIRVRYSVTAGQLRGSLFQPVDSTIAFRLTYDKNAQDAAGQVPSDTTANTVKQAKSKTNGSVRLAADDDVAEYAVNGLPDHLVNGDFEYPVKSDMPANDGKFWYISQNDGSYFVPGKRYKLPEGFDKAKFAWHSTQTGDTHYPDLERADDVQVNYKADGTNHYSEISAAQSGATIYQDVATVPGVMYKWSLKHASLDSSHLDKMSVIIGEPGKETAQEATRTTANGHGDKLGKVGTVISTKVSNPEMPDGNKFQEGAHTGQWETYTGTYIATGTVTRFAFHSVEGYNAWNGNLLDDISFSKAYKLTYDKNASDATGQVPSNQRGKENAVEPAESKTTGNVKTVADNTSNLPDHLVNGTFDYRGNEIINENQRVYGDTTYLAMISAKTGVIGNPLHSKLDNWDSGKFGWRSNDATAGVDTVEVQRRNHTPYPTNAGNVWGEIAAAKRGKYIYQDIATTPGVVYKWSLKHASRNADQDDSMQVMIGEPGKTVAQQATRTTSNGSDKTGSVGTTIITHGTAQDGKWETYTGDYLATSTVTRFTFRSVRDSNGQGLDFTAEGNCVDDLSFDKAYKLSYDKNSSDETGSVPSNQYGKENTVQPAKSKTTGSVGLAADKTASGLTVHDLKNDKGKVPSSSKADSTQPAAFKAPDAKVETIASRAAGDELAVNGGFDTPKWSIAKEGQGLPWVYVKPNAGTIRSYAQAMAGQAGVKAGGLTAATFAWQDLDAIGSNQNFELHREKDGNTAADVHAGRTVAQTVNTTPGASYTFSIRHSGRSKGNAGGVTLLTGPDKDHLTPVKLTRTTVSKTGQKYGDKTGDVGTVAYTHSDSMDATEGSHEPWDHSDDWESYEGTVIIPAGQSRTMIAYRGVAKDGTLTASANDSIIDDLSFRLAYRLGYDGNGGTGQVPSRTETGRTETAASGTDGTVRLAADKSAGPESGTIADDRRVLTDTTARQDDGTSQRTITRSDGSVRVETIATTGAVSGCQVYYPAGTRITLATAKIDSDCWDSSQIGKTNRTFYGWSANTDAHDRDVPVADTMDRNTLNANARTEIVMPARAKTVYALWAINPTLSYNVNTPAGSNAPGTPASQTVPYNTAAADKSGWAAGDTGKIPGYRFDGWYTAPNGGNKYDFNTPLTGNVTVYAHWIGNGYTVRFTGNGATGGGTPDQAFQYNIGQNLRRNGFVRDGYTFTGWKRADNQQAYGDGQWVTNLTTQPNGIVTMVAQWSANEAHIRYNPNPPAGKTTGGQGTPNWDGHTGDTPAIGGNGWTIDGYTFAGWATSPDGGGTKYAPGASWTANGTLTLYAQWTPGEAGLTYDGNGATGGKTDPQNGVADQKVNVRQNGFTRDGYTFVRWDTQADCRGKAVNPGDKWTLQGSSTLYACWAGVAQTLTYHGNGATGGNTAAQSGHTGDELTTNANGFTRDGYTFVRWDTAKDGSGIAYGEGKNGVGRYTMKPAGNDLYAIWQANPATIQYRNDWPNTTGSTPDTTGNTGQDVTIAQNGFTRPGYTFTGWARDRRTNPSLQPGGRYTLTPGTTTLWAQWKADPAHLIYNSNSGSTSQTRRTDGVVDQTLTVIANPFTRTGYTFTGWNTQADGRGRTYTAGNGFRLVADPKSNPVNTSVLYAQWRINRVTLKFNPNGGTGGYPDITVDAFTTVTIPADAKEPKVQRPGFRFTGWAMKPTPGAGDTILSPGKGTVSMPDRGSITVYAQWAPAMTTLPFTGGQAQVPTIWLYAGFALMLIALGVMMPMLRMRMAATKRTGKHMPITGGKHAK